MAIEALSTIHATDYKPGEIEIGITSASGEISCSVFPWRSNRFPDDEPVKSRGLWRVMDDEEKETWLLAYAEKD